MKQPVDHLLVDVSAGELDLAAAKDTDGNTMGVFRLSESRYRRLPSMVARTVNEDDTCTIVGELAVCRIYGGSHRTN